MKTKLDEMTEEFAKAYVAYHDATDYQRYKDNPQCVKDEYHYVYWKAREVAGRERQTDIMLLLLAIGICAFFVIVILILVIVFKNVKPDEESIFSADEKNNEEDKKREPLKPTN